MSPAFFGWWKHSRQRGGFPECEAFFGGPVGALDDAPLGRSGHCGPRSRRGGSDESQDSTSPGEARDAAGGPDDHGGGRDRRDDLGERGRFAGGGPDRHGGHSGNGGHGCGPGGGWGPGGGHRFGGRGVGGGGGFGVVGSEHVDPGLDIQRSLRFLASKLDLDQDQITEIAARLDELNIERAQAAVELRSTTSALADAIGASELDEAKIAEATNTRVKATQAVQSTIASALSKLHHVLREEQRQRLGYLIRTGVFSL